MVPDCWKLPLGSSSFTSLLGGCFFAFELSLREEQKQDVGGWGSGKGRAASLQQVIIRVYGDVLYPVQGSWINRDRGKLRNQPGLSPA